MDAVGQLVAHQPGRTPLAVRTHTNVTSQTEPAYGVRMRTIDWPQREAFIAHLDRRRREAGYSTWQALADAAGVSHSAISNWRGNKQRPSMEALYGLAEALGQPDTAHSLAELAGILDPERFGRAGPSVKRDEAEEMILNSDVLSPGQKRMMLERYHRKLEEGRRELADDVREQIEMMQQRATG